VCTGGGRHLERSSRNRLSGIRENALFALIMTQFTPIPIYNPVGATCRSHGGFFYLRHVRSLSRLSPSSFFFFPKSRREYTRYSHLGAPASSSLVICVATMADRRPGNYSVCMRACLSLSLSLSRPSFVSLSAAASRASFLSAVRVILRFETSCPIPRLRPPTHVSPTILSRERGPDNQVSRLHGVLLCTAALLLQNSKYR